MDKDCVALLDKLEKLESEMRDLRASWGLLACRAKNMTQAEFNRAGDQLDYREEDLLMLFDDLYDAVERATQKIGGKNIKDIVGMARLLSTIVPWARDDDDSYLPDRVRRKALKKAVDKGYITVKDALDLDIAFFGKDTTRDHSIRYLKADRAMIAKYPKYYGEKEHEWCKAWDSYISNYHARTRTRHFRVRRREQT